MILKKFLPSNKMDVLVGLYIFCIVAAEVMGSKTFPILTAGNFTLNSGVGLLFIPAVYIIIDIITDVLGKDRAKSVVRTGWLIIILLVFAAFIATSLPPSTRYAPNESAYDLIFTQSIRISIASLTAFVIANLTDIYVFSKIKAKTKEKKLWLRSNLANWISLFLDTAVFIILAFYSFDLSVSENASFLFSLILPYWLLKCLMSIIETPFVYLGVKWLKKGLNTNSI